MLSCVGVDRYIYFVVVDFYGNDYCGNWNKIFVEIIFFFIFVKMKCFFKLICIIV